MGDYFNQIPTAARLPIVKTDSHGHYYPHVIRDHRQRKVVAYGTIPYKNNEGSTVPTEIRRSLFEFCNGESTDHAGHIIPRCLNGSGRHQDNLYPQNAKANSWTGSMERILKAARLAERIDIQFIFLFEYDNDEKPRRPTRSIQNYRWYKNGVFMDEFAHSLDNPTYAETEGIVSADKAVLWNELKVTPDMCQASMIKTLNLVPVDNRIKVTGSAMSTQTTTNYLKVAQMISMAGAGAVIAGGLLAGKSRTSTSVPVPAEQPAPVKAPAAPPINTTPVLKNVAAAKTQQPVAAPAAQPVHASAAVPRTPQVPVRARGFQLGGTCLIPEVNPLTKQAPVLRPC